jgi:hypothetical protein
MVESYNLLRLTADMAEIRHRRQDPGKIVAAAKSLHHEPWDFSGRPTC